MVAVGAKQVITGLENALIGMKKDDIKEITIPPEEAFGLKDPELIKKVPRELFEQNNIEPIEGMTIRTAAGLATIESVAEDVVVVDLNHPLAGKTFTFEIEIEDIVPKK